MMTSGVSLSAVPLPRRRRTTTVSPSLPFFVANSQRRQLDDCQPIGVVELIFPAIYLCRIRPCNALTSFVRPPPRKTDPSSSPSLQRVSQLSGSSSSSLPSVFVASSPQTFCHCRCRSGASRLVVDAVLLVSLRPPLPSPPVTPLSPSIPASFSSITNLRRDGSVSARRRAYRDFASSCHSSGSGVLVAAADMWRLFSAPCDRLTVTHSIRRFGSSTSERAAHKIFSSDFSFAQRTFGGVKSKANDHNETRSGDGVAKSDNLYSSELAKASKSRVDDLFHCSEGIDTYRDDYRIYYANLHFDPQFLIFQHVFSPINIRLTVNLDFGSAQKFRL
ncbi:unnamed protein product [Soboliphyme baturini]|uniref:Uncharacterized protein n=1 Tax=Soboliphyme baturini TaxID=241478 RepID=A0A183J0A1_9BILA|nr:unnamed protein product [Soboliphyme baturini]